MPRLRSWNTAFHRLIQYLIICWPVEHYCGKCRSIKRCQVDSLPLFRAIWIWFALCFCCGSDGTEPACNAGDPGSILVSCRSYVVNHQNLCLKISVKQVYHEMEGDNLVFLIQGALIWRPSSILHMSGKQIHSSSSSLAWFLPKTPLSHFTENPEHV